ncbi:MAG: Hsp20/alpha crystallin family protein [Deltaproteobacteria bacterium]|nr:Hsp20/alpha crystallin family protein [Deltaproteobacteria bacterium]
MSLEKWNPLRELESMKREMDKIWDDVFASPRRVEVPWRRPAERGGVASPAVDIIDKPNEIIVKAEMPGVAKENIDISMQEGTLTLKGEIKEEAEKENGEYSYSERTYRYYSRAINIPVKIAAEAIKATLKDGILSVHLPKAEDLQPKKIKVEIA